MNQIPLGVRRHYVRQHAHGLAAQLSELTSDELYDPTDGDYRFLRKLMLLLALQFDRLGPPPRGAHLRLMK